MTPPVVTEVLVAGTTWTPSFLDYLNTAGLGNGGFTILDGSNAQTTSVLWTNVNQIKLRFNEDVQVGIGDLTVKGIQDTEGWTAVRFEYDQASFTATWTIAGFLKADKWVLDLSDAVTDLAGNLLDGDWASASSLFPLGDGVAGHDFRYQINTIPGDVIGDDIVQQVDVNLIKSNQFKSTDSPGYSPFLDMNGSGRILVDDVILARNLQASTLPIANHDLLGPSLAAALGNDSGLSALDGITFDHTVTGNVTDPSSIAVLSASLDGGAFVDIMPFLNPDGTFTLDAAAMLQIAGGLQVADGAHTLRIEAEDSVNNASTFNLAFTLDTQAPTQASFGLTAASRLNSANPALTVLTQVSIEGQADAGQSITLTKTGSVAIADQSGQFTFSGLPITSGLNPLTTTVKDVAGNEAHFTLSIALVEDGSSFTLVEGNSLATERSMLIDLGQTEGGRLLRFQVSGDFDTSDSQPVLEDLFQVYLRDPSNPGQTLLDRGIPGTALFSLAGTKADFQAGLVRFDGKFVEVDLTSLDDQAMGLLVFQLINSDADTGTQITVSQITNELDPEGVESPIFPLTLAQQPGAAIADLTGYAATADVVARLLNVRLDTEAGLYIAELELANLGLTTLSRNMAVLFPGVPDGVTIRNASGLTADGTPYVNVRDQIASGGLMRGARSQRIQIEVDDPNLLRFSLTPQVLSTGVNQAPVFSPVGPLTITPGAVLQVPLSATDPDGDDVYFLIRPDGPLPTGVLNSSGELRFTPTPDQLGQYTFTLIATDGTASTEQQVTLDVVADPQTSTRISGQILDVDGTPLAEVPISIGRITVLTDADGRFTLELPSILLPTESFDIDVPQGDVHFDPFNTGTQTISFRRAGFDTSTGTSTSDPRLHPNLVTSFIDASMVYGSNDQRAMDLRTLTGGRLKASSGIDGDLLPLNNTTFFPDGPLENDDSGTFDPTSLFVAGDVRASENVALSSLQTLLMREHNRLADEIFASDPMLTDEEIYQQARRMVGAMIQQITYSEYLPVLLGETAIAPYTGYQEDVNPDAGAFFATVAFRIGHSQMVSQLQRLDAAGDPLPGGPLDLRSVFFTSQPILEDGIEPYLRGLITQAAEEIDVKIVDELRNFLFGPPGSGGMDLPAMSIQRARDMGLPSYNEARADYGLPVVTNFDQITTDVAVRNLLQATYGSVDLIDAFVGGLAEDHVAGAQVGELFRTAIAQQFERSRDGDRFWYENNRFTVDELAEIRGTTLADLIERNTSITNLPANVFTTGLVPTAPDPAGGSVVLAPMEFRSADGGGNNLTDLSLGSTGEHLLIDSSLNYADGISQPNGTDRPGPREVTNGVLDQSNSIPSASGLTTMAVFWGQILSHDISLTATGISDTLRINGDQADVAGKSYPFLAENLDIVLGHDVYVGVNNVIDRPIYLPAIDVAGGTFIVPTQDTMIQYEIAPGKIVSVFVAAGTLVDRQGNPFTGVVSITQVPATLTPAGLPQGLFPGTVITIQPGGMVFTTPAPITFPNTDGYLPGEILDLWSANPNTGQFELVGKMQVSVDGLYLNTIEGGITNTSWHFPVLPPPPPADMPPPSDLTENQDELCNRCEATAQATSEVELHSGAVLETHSLVGYQSLGAMRGLTLHYNSQQADPRPIVHFQMDNVLIGGWRYVYAKLRYFAGETTIVVPGINPQDYLSPFGIALDGFSGSEHIWAVPPGVAGNNLALALQADLSQLSTGVYEYELERGLVRGELDAFQQAVRQATIDRDETVIVNQIASTFGAGWSLGATQQLVESPAGSLLLVDGSGASVVFRPLEDQPGQYQSPVGEFSTLVKHADGSFTRTTTDQTVYEYDTAGRMVTMTDRNGNATTHVYEDGRLVKIVDPVGLETLLTYLEGHVASIIDPAGRATLLEHDAAGNLTRITDPDVASRVFDYDAAHHLIAEVDQVGQREQTLYGFHGRATGSIRKDGSTLSFDPLQTRALLPAEQTADFVESFAFDPVTNRSNFTFDPPLAPSATSLAVARSSDANGNTTTTVLDKAGQAVSRTDALGNLPSVQRNADNLVNAVTDGRGFVSSYVYDDQGNLLSFTDEVVRLANAGGSLFPGEKFIAGSRPYSVTVGDFNGDGISDLAVANYSDDVSVLLGAGDGTFAAEQRFAAGSQPFSVTVGDFNGDGISDLATANFNSNDVSVLLGLGDGTFAVQQRFAAGNRPVSVTVGDFDGDGFSDLAVANNLGNDVSVLLGVGDGTFVEQQRFTAGNRPLSVALGDFNGDGISDLAVANYLSNDLSVLLGVGDGTFAVQQRFAVGTRPRSVTVSDFNGDGISDLAAANSNSYDVSVLLGVGDGTFADQQRFAVDSGPLAVAVGDFNGDGISDLGLANSEGNEVSVLLGVGDGSFAAPQNFAVGNNPFSLTVGDFNGDGFSDLAVANHISDDMSVLLGAGDGSFAAHQRFAAQSAPLSVTVGDFNGDGINDLAVANYAGYQVSVLMGVGAGSFAAPQSFAAGSQPQSLTVGDFNGDGISDLAVANRFSYDVSVLLGVGDGTFADQQRFGTGSQPISVSVGDFNGDGISDLAVANRSSNDVSVLLGVGDGTFASQQSFAVGSIPSSVSVGDFNGDGISDLATSNFSSDDVSVLLGVGDGTFTSQQAFTAGSSPYAVSVGDFNGDGISDLATANFSSDDVSVLLGVGDGTFAAQQRFSAGGQPYSVSVGDFDGDGISDLTVANRDSNDISVLLGLGDGTFAAQRRFVAGSSPVSVTVGDFNSDGISDLAVANGSSNDVSVLLGNRGTAGAGSAAPVIFTYDDTFNQITRITDELGRVTLFDIDPANGNRLATIQVIGERDSVENGESDDLITTYTYTPQGLLDLIVDPLGRITDIDYNSRGLITAVTMAVGTAAQATRSFEHDAAGNTIAVIDENGNRTQFEFDAMSRLTRITEADPDGGGPLAAPITQVAFDARSRLVEVTDATGSTLERVYDAMDRLILTRDNDGNETAFNYDIDGNLIETIDSNGNTTRFAYDARDRRSSIIDPDAGVTTFHYDRSGNLLFLIDPAGNTTRYAYDARSRLVREVDPLGAETLYSYDAVNNLTRKTDRNERVTQFEYDDLNRLISETWKQPGGATVNTIDYAYDKASNLLSVFDNVSALELTYDSRNRLLTQDNTGTLAGSGLPDVVLSYTYDGVGNVLSVTEAISGAAGATTAYTYDALNRMTQVTQMGASVTDKRVDLAYNAIGQFSQINRFSDLTGTQLVIGTDYTYDALNRLTSMSHDNAGGTAVAFYNFEYDPASRITALTDIDGRTDYTYDDRDQLTGASRDVADTRGDEDYTYDANGNRVDSHLHGSGYVTGANNRLLSDGTFNYAYDDEGNMILKTNIATGAVREFEWDHRNRLVRVTDRVSVGGIITQEVEYVYDALNRRIAKTVDADGEGVGGERTEHYVYDRMHVALEFIDADGSGAIEQPELAMRNLFGPGIDQILAQEDIIAAQTRWLLTDHLGTVRDIVSDAGIVLNHILYDSFGNILSQTDPAFATRYGFTGREFDAETGLHYFRARYYDAQLGRFIGEDPIRMAGGDVNLNRYVGNAPLNGVDPMGLNAISPTPQTPPMTSSQAATAAAIIAVVAGDDRAYSGIEPYWRIMPESWGMSGAARNWWYLLTFADPESVDAYVCSGITTAAYNALTRAPAARLPGLHGFVEVTREGMLGTVHTALLIVMNDGSMFVFDWHATLNSGNPMISLEDDWMNSTGGFTYESLNGS